MSQYQNDLYQLQDDFFSDFDSSLSIKKAFNPKVDPMNTKYTADTLSEAKRSDEVSVGTKKASPLVIPYDEDFACDDCIHFQLFALLEKLNSIREEVAAVLIRKVENFRALDFVNIVDDIIGTVDDFVYNIPKHENELWIVTSLCLFFYGGSWGRLASLVAASEVFGTKEVVHAAYEVGRKFMGAEVLDVAPEDLKKIFKDLGLHFGLILAVLTTDFWAEVCVTLAFASKLIPMIRLHDNIFDIKVNEDSDDVWLTFLFSVVALIISSIFLCFCPMLGSAMYLAFVGMKWFLNGKRPLCLPSGSFTTRPFVVITAEDFGNPNHQSSLWLNAAFTALWQAYHGYSGVLVFLSWSMFLLPLVNLFNFFTSPFHVHVRCLKIE